MDDPRDILDPDRDRRYPEDMRAILAALDALALYGDLWGLLSLARRAAWDARWRERMEPREGLPGRFSASRPTLAEPGTTGGSKPRSRSCGRRSSVWGCTRHGGGDPGATQERSYVQSIT